MVNVLIAIPLSTVYSYIICTLSLLRSYSSLPILLYALLFLTLHLHLSRIRIPQSGARKEEERRFGYFDDGTSRWSPLRDPYDGKGWNEERSDDKEHRDAMANTRKNDGEEVENETSIGAA